MVTTIQISDELWEKLNSMKTAREKTFEDVLNNLIDKKVAQPLTKSKFNKIMKEKRK